MVDKIMCKICDKEKEDIFDDKVHTMIHDLIPVLNRDTNDVGLIAMIKLLAANYPYKEKLIEIVEHVFDEQVKKREDKGEDE